MKAHVTPALTLLLLLTVVLWAGVAPPASGAPAPGLPGEFAIQTSNGHYLTALGGGGKPKDALHSDATQIGAWETFRLVPMSFGVFAIETTNGHYLTAVGGGGQTQDAVHSDATQVGAWERFAFVDQGGGQYAIRTNANRYLTAVGGGGQTSDVVHTDAAQVSGWEKWRLVKSGDVAAGYQYAIQMYDGHFLTAVDGSGRTTQVIHIDATNIGAWETFRIIRQGDGTYAFQTTNGHYLTAVGGGGLYPTPSVPDVLHTDATNVGSWETFRLLPQNNGKYVIQTTVKGKYLSVPNGQIHTAGDLIAGPDQFRLILLGSLGLRRF